MQRVDRMLRLQPGNYPLAGSPEAEPLLARMNRYPRTQSGPCDSLRQTQRSNDPDIWYLAAENPRAGRQIILGVAPARAEYFMLAGRP